MSRQSTTSGTNSPRGGSLSSAVSSLVRAQYGLAGRSEAGEPSTDLDKHVADLLLQEAREREARAKASNSTTAWSFSDDEDGEGGKQYKNKTNKRFLKNILKGVEDHNAPLRRKEERESLDEIRKREREAREKRLGIKDSERSSHGKWDNNSSATLAVSRAGPGFAARMLATGLSGALNAREDRNREDRHVRSAIEEARRRAEKDSVATASTSSSRREPDSDYREGKGKERERRKDYDEDQEAERPRRRRRSTSIDRDDDERHGSSRHRSRRGSTADYSDEDASRRRHRTQRSRSRSRSPRRREDTNGSARHRDGYTGRRDKDSRKHRREGDDKDSRQKRSLESDSKDRSRRRRRRSVSEDSISSLSEHASEASSDTFIDYTGAVDAIAPSEAAAGSKMDKYFSSNYNPALDINVGDLEDPKTGLIGEGNFSEWDQMLHTLKQRKEDKVFGVTRAREEERERQLRKMERRRRREERELRHALRKKEKKSSKKKKRRRSDSDSASSDSEASVGPKESMRSDRKRSKDPGTVNIDGFEYAKRGSTRAWDLGKS